MYLIVAYGDELPFTLSALIHLKRLSIYVEVYSTEIETNWALPEIIRVANTTPAIQKVDLRLHYRFSGPDTTYLAQLDWSRLGHLKSNSTGKCHLIDLCVTGDFTRPDSIRDALVANESLMGMVKRGLVRTY